MTLTEFLLARIAEDEKDARPKTVVVSGGWPAPEVPNCIGPSGTGDCGQQWRLEAEPGNRWWKRPDVQAQMRAHEWTHASNWQRRVLAECKAKRQIVEMAKDGNGLDAAERNEYGVGPDDSPYFGDLMLTALALPYADHPDYDPEWRP